MFYGIHDIQQGLCRWAESLKAAVGRKGKKEETIEHKRALSSEGSPNQVLVLSHSPSVSPPCPVAFHLLPSPPSLQLPPANLHRQTAPAETSPDLYLIVLWTSRKYIKFNMSKTKPIISPDKPLPLCFFPSLGAQARHTEVPLRAFLAHSPANLSSSQVLELLAPNFHL